MCYQTVPYRVLSQPGRRDNPVQKLLGCPGRNFFAFYAIVDIRLFIQQQAFSVATVRHWAARISSGDLQPLPLVFDQANAVASMHVLGCHGWLTCVLAN